MSVLTPLLLSYYSARYVSHILFTLGSVSFLPFLALLPPWNQFNNDIIIGVMAVTESLCYNMEVWTARSWHLGGTVGPVENAIELHNEKPGDRDIFSSVVSIDSSFNLFLVSSTALWT